MPVETAPAYEPETPFEGILEAPTPPADPALNGVGDRVATETPFLPEYWKGEDGEATSPAAVELVALLDELWDREFDEMTLKLAEEAAAAVEERLPQGEEPAARERFVERWLEPLREQGERLLDDLAEAVSDEDIAQLSEGELDARLARVEVGQTDLSPTFEGFLGGLLKKAKRVAKGAWTLAKKGIAAVGKVLPINILLAKLKAFVRPLLQRVLSKAIGNLPADLRPIATQLAKRLLGSTLGESEHQDEPELETPATADVGVIQQEFDLATASLLFAADETEGDIALAEYSLEAQGGGGDAALELDAARSRFIAEVAQLGEDEDPAPVVQNFLPAILPVARMAIRVGGRDRVVRFLAGYLSPLIERYVGREKSAPLSRAIVDAGLRSISLEAPPEAETEAAGSALAGTLEDTIHRLGELGEHVFEDEELLADETYRAFEAAAASNMPPATLQPALRPGATLTGTWMLMPVERPSKAFKKYSQVLDARVSPGVAQRLTTFGGTPLGEFLSEHERASGTIEASVHLYEAIPGTTLDRVAALERGTAAGPPRADGQSLHPLTTEAAGMLFAEPGLGRDVSAEFLSDPDQIAVGQRFFALQFPGAAPPPAAPKRASRASATIDISSKRCIRLALYFSEAEAQQLATLAKGKKGGATLRSAISAAVKPRLSEILSGRVKRRVRFLARTRIPGYQEQWLVRLHAFVPRMPAKLTGWLEKGLAADPQLGHRFAEAAAKDADGLTLVVRFDGISGLDTIGSVIRKHFPGGIQVESYGPPVRTTIEVLPGARQ